jgi:hypothetical protein
MLRTAKIALSEKMFSAIEEIALEYEKNYDIKIQWQANLKINDDDFFDFKTGDYK